MWAVTTGPRGYSLLKTSQRRHRQVSAIERIHRATQLPDPDNPPTAPARPLGREPGTIKEKIPPVLPSPDKRGDGNALAPSTTVISHVSETAGVTVIPTAVNRGTAEIIKAEPSQRGVVVFFTWEVSPPENPPSAFLLSAAARSVATWERTDPAAWGYARSRRRSGSERPLAAGSWASWCRSRQGLSTAVLRLSRVVSELCVCVLLRQIGVK
ncbi:hypothetical protein N658DRAFT_270248 [Parathielavia hyrcaniae]|uniref:Uncharacterized protein n=1 Tax=Parathielavia hyrcaniae TaxID=113614 RepID=A0AAN6SYI9_9PEZI|nr:hypothetical protein N658DRAFT_270248 [Parathielavia hyrcaniae]